MDGRVTHLNVELDPKNPNACHLSMEATFLGSMGELHKLLDCVRGRFALEAEAGGGRINIYNTSVLDFGKLTDMVGRHDKELDELRQRGARLEQPRGVLCSSCGVEIPECEAYWVFEDELKRETICYYCQSGMKRPPKWKAVDREPENTANPGIVGDK